MATSRFSQSGDRTALSGPFEEDRCGYLLGNSTPLQRIRAQLRRLAPYFRIALVTAEDGCGKETVARILHARSGRSGQPLLPRLAEEFVGELSGIALPASESPSSSHDGTLFLRAVDELSRPSQEKLLRKLEQPEFFRSARIVASTERDLRTLVTLGRFREDLYRRISVVEVALPPLRERSEDIPEMTCILWQRLVEDGTVSPEALSALRRFSWPGNVRQLREVLQHASATAGTTNLQPLHLPSLLSSEAHLSMEQEKHSDRLQDVVRNHVLTVLTQCSGNKLRASEVLGISRSTLYRMLDACSGGHHSGYTGLH